MDTSNAPTLSVGLPVYNGSKWLGEAIESMLAQSFTDFEIVISDNASTDSTGQICAEYRQKDSRVRYHRNEKNIGLYNNFNKVFELARGEYFKWAADSDFCLDGFFEKCVAELERRPDCVLAYPRAYMLVKNATGEEVPLEYFEDFNLQDSRPSTRFKKYLDRERINNLMHGVMRTSALKETALIRPLPGSDISMIAELSLRGKFIEVPDRLFVRRFDEETSSMLMKKKTAAKRDVPMGHTIGMRMDLHAYRFISTLRAPIPATEKARVWLYLMGRALDLRGEIVGRIVGRA